MGGSAAQELSIEEAMVSPELAARTAMTRLREERGWNHSELARQVGTSPTQIRKLENGDLNISLVWMRRLAAAFGVKMSAFLPPDEIEFAADDATREVIDLVRDMVAAERRHLLGSARELMLLARHIARRETGARLAGNAELADDFAAHWDRWDDHQRRTVLNLALAAEPPQAFRR
jgi:transcriptional regulator with XRE-family HTH domain